MVLVLYNMNDGAAVRKQLDYLAVSAGSSRLGINHQNMRILRIHSLTYNLCS